ncbi:MAG: TIGR00282 family metallophosphoesterase [Acidobacteriota bacterium]
MSSPTSDSTDTVLEDSVLEDTVRLLFVGDVMGRPGRRALQRLLPTLIDEHRLDYVIVNIENSAGGIGITPDVLNELDALPIDCFSSGNHIWDKREGVPLLDKEPRLLRPANYPAGNPGRGLYVGETAAGVKVATINLEGRVFMKNLDDPFLVADRLLDELNDDVKIVLVDFHAEATSEKQALGLYLDGRVSAVFGTHTHVPTADERILPDGTAFITDVGMTGPYQGVIGCKFDKVLQRFQTQRGVHLDVAKKDVRLAGAVVHVDPATGHAVHLERLLLPMPH